MAILSLDDLIKEETTISFNGKTYHFNLSLKAMLKFKAWSERNNVIEEISNEKALTELLRIIILESDTFIEEIENLSINNQTRILTEVTTKWVSEMIPKNNSKDGEEKKS